MAQLYDDEELTYFTNHIGEILTKIDDIVGIKLDPTRKEINEIIKNISEYLQQNKRKVYGGSALNLAIKMKSPEMAIYSNDEEPHDFDVYSPDPIKDIVNICNILHEKGFKNIVGREALHTESYSVVVNDHQYCDISYSPRNVYNKTPFMTVEGFTIAHPQFMWIDFLRMFVDPMLSAKFRWEKHFKRFYLLQKFYPIRKNNKRVVFDGKAIDVKVYDKIFDHLKTTKTIIVIGQCVYNMYVDVSKISSKYIMKMPITQIELIATEYEQDVKSLIEYMKSNISKDIQVKEYYPFFQVTGYSTEIILNDRPIIKIYNYNKICFPFSEHKGVLIGSFHLNLLYVLIDAIYARANENRKEEQTYFEMAAHFIQMRREFMAFKDKTFLDDTIFKDFSGDCVGQTKQGKIEKLEEKRAGIKKHMFSYNPEKPGGANEANWTYMNSSGNMVHNPKNYRIKLDPDIHVVIKEEIKDDKPKALVDQEDKSREPDKNEDNKTTDLSEFASF